MVLVKQIFEELQATNSKIEKEQIIRTNADNILFKETLHFLLNPFITTGLSDRKINKVVDVETTRYFNSALEVMGYLANNNTGTDEIIENVQNFINDQQKDMKEYYHQLFTKTLRLGCAANTANKVLGKSFIPKFEVMLAEKYFDHINKVEGKEFTITLKLDGIRCIAIKDGNNISFFSRQGQPINGLVDIQDEMRNHPSKQFVLDGELLISNTVGIPSKEQYKATTKIVRKDGVKHGITFRAFDFLRLDEFQNQECKTPYVQRREILESMFKETKFTEVLPVLYSGNDTSKIIEILDSVRADGEEGCMVSINNAPYEFKRTQSLLKVKVMQDADLRIIGFEEGSGRLKGVLGRLTVDYKGSELGVGSGFSDEQRKYFWDNQNELLNRVVCVQYFEETQDKDGKLSLRFPVFKELRYVGKEVSYS